MSQISIEDLRNKTGNIYEAVVVMSKRARQINDEQKMQIEMEMEHVPQVNNRDNEDFDDVEIDREALMREHKTYPKPSTLSLDQMLKDKINFRYIEPEDQQE
jgi:DNA-directed RNA polymerase omega subunit